MKTIQLLKRVERLPLFSENDVAKIINKSPEYIRTLLYRLHKNGLIRRVENGKYTVYDDPMVFSSYIVLPSYLSLWTALRYYNMTEQQPYSVFVMVPSPKKSLTFAKTPIAFFSTKHMFGYKKERYNDVDIFMAEREKAIIDSLLFRIPMADIKTALESEEVDLKKLSEYAQRTASISLMKRLGYLLETLKGSSYGLKALDNNYVRLDYLAKKRGKKDKKWKLIINVGL